MKATSNMKMTSNMNITLNMKMTSNKKATPNMKTNNMKNDLKYDDKLKQAGAELCQAQKSPA